MGDKAEQAYDIPGTHTIELEKTGTYNVDLQVDLTFNESDSLKSLHENPQIELVLISSNEDTIPLVPSQFEARMSKNGGINIRLFTCTVHTKGQYIFTGTNAIDTGQCKTIRFSKEEPNIILQLGVGFLILLCSILCSLFLLFATPIKRKSTKNEATPKPSNSSYLIATLIAGVGIILFLVPIISAIRESVTIKRYNLPGEHSITIPNAGNYNIMHEYETMLDGTQLVSSPKDFGEINISLISSNGDTVLFANDYGATTEGDSTKSVSLYAFTITNPGNYTLLGTTNKQLDTPKVITITKDLRERIQSIFQGIGLFLLSILIALVIIIKTITVKNNYNKQEKNRTSPASGSF